MARPSIPNQRKQYKELEKRIRSYVLLVEDIYDSLAEEAADIALRTGFDPASGRPFRFSDYPATADRVRTLQGRMADDIEAVIYRGTSAEWAASNEVQNLLATGVLKEYTGVIDRQKYRILFQDNSDALRAFRDRVDNGMTISDKLWEQSGSMRAAMEEAISCAIRKGTSAVTLSKRISQYLQDYPKLARDYGKKYGIAATAGDCEYRSIRLATSEINMAYRNAENERWAQMDFVVGYEIKLSSNHNCKGVKSGHFYDICDELAGKYPKDFKWSGWHPMCYSADTYVLTDSGWRLFKDVDDGDKIMSLDPDTFHVEWVGFTDRQIYGYDGEMIRFHNRSLDCLVTPDHNMIYIGKSTNKIQSCSAYEYRMGKGAFYRGCIYDSNDIQSINIGSTNIDFDSFCEFMGYWLSDGSTIRKSQIVISQQDGESAKEHIVGCIHKMGFTPHVSFDKISFYNRDLCQYLKRFGKCIDKYVPKCIKNASKRQIKIFLDAFIKCDGYIKKPKAFIGNRGGLCKGSEERMYFTTSHQMASDIGELILKSGKRPSFRKMHNEGREIRFKNGIYKQNYDSFVISECSSLTATVFSKSIVKYDGFVYDLTLEKNHIMYVMRNGKCFWGSNCRCYKIPILKTEEEFWSWDGRSEVSSRSVNEVRDVPKNFKEWIDRNIHRAKNWESEPYFIKDNKDFIREDFKVNVYNKTEKSFVRKRRTNLAMSRVEYYIKTYPDIPEVSLAAINAYTQSVTSGNNRATSREINRRLRNNTEDEYVKVASSLISKGLKDIPKYTGIVYRGETMSMNKLKDRFLNHIGEVISDKGFISSSIYKDTPIKFISHDGVPKSHKKVIFEIQSKNGRNISKISEFNGIFNPENQHEVLFDKGTKFLLSSIPEERNGIVYIKLIEQ